MWGQDTCPTTLTHFAYDANGNLTSDGTNTYVYDVENRPSASLRTGMVCKTGGGKNATLRYDPLGRPCRRSISGTA